MKKIILTLLLTLCVVILAKAEQKDYGNLRNVFFVACYDGDTCKFNIKHLHPIIGNEINIRVAGIDTPELRAKCDVEKQLAISAKLFVQNELMFAKRIDLLNIKRGKYFRIVADVEVDGKDIGKLLLDKGFAVEYDGGKKTKNWCE